MACCCTGRHGMAMLSMSSTASLPLHAAVSCIWSVCSVNHCGTSNHVWSTGFLDCCRISSCPLHWHLKPQTPPAAISPSPRARLSPDPDPQSTSEGVEGDPTACSLVPILLPSTITAICSATSFAFCPGHSLSWDLINQLEGAVGPWKQLTIS